MQSIASTFSLAFSSDNLFILVHLKPSRRFANKIRKLANDPESYGKPLRGLLHGYWELYFEKSFRVLYIIDQENKIVTIEAIKHKDEF